MAQISPSNAITSFYLPKVLRAQLQTHMDQTGMKLAEVLRVAAAEYLARQATAVTIEETQ